MTKIEEGVSIASYLLEHQKEAKLILESLALLSGLIFIGSVGGIVILDHAD